MYKCKCGKEFDKPNSFNAHKSHCKIHLGEERYLARTKNSSEAIKKGTRIRSEKHQSKRIKELNAWILEKHKCKRCGKVMIDKFGSGIYCSRKCANSRPHTIFTKNIPPCTSRLASKIICEVCGKEVYESKYPQHLNKHNSLVVVGFKEKVALDITNKKLDEYRKIHPVCEICGSPEIASTRKDRSKPNKLTIDHDHKTGKFRGLLCFKCNTNLGFYEKYKDDFEKYLQSKN